MSSAEGFRQLAHYRRQVAELYAAARQEDEPIEDRWQAWREGRNRLFAIHPQSALDAAQKDAFSTLNYYDYDPSLRFIVTKDYEVEPDVIELPLQDDGVFKMQRYARAQFEVMGEPQTLYLYWILGYGGGMFLPFRDQTNQVGETYGGGRYLLDTLKGADLGGGGDQIILDFNFAYNPSCAYNVRWHCPLAPQENWLPVEIRAGEMVF